MSLRADAAQGVLWSGLQRIGAQVLSLGVFIVLSRLLEPEDFGVMAMANVVVLAGILLIEQGMNQAVVQRATLNDRHLDSAFVFSLAMSAAVSAITLLVAAPLALAFREPRLTGVLIGISPAFFLAGLRATQTAVFQRRMRFRGLAIRSMAAEAAGGAVGITMAVQGLGVWSLVGQALGRGLVALAVLWRISDWRPRLKPTRAATRDLWSFGAPVVLNRLVLLVQGKADDVVIGGTLGAVWLGYYSIGYRLLTYVTTLVVGTFQSVALPVLSRLQEESGRHRSAFLETLETMTLGAFPAFVGIALLAPRVIPFAFGERWSPSTGTVQILSLAGAVQVVPAVSTTFLMSMGRSMLPMRVNLVFAVAGIAGFVALVHLGIEAVALVHLTLGLLAVPVHAILIGRSTGLPVSRFFRAMLRPAVGIVVMSAVVLGVELAAQSLRIELLRLLLMVAAGAAAYLGATYPVSVRAIRFARDTVRRELVGGPAAQPVDE